jgi:hypothetical protein
MDGVGSHASQGMRTNLQQLFILLQEDYEIKPNYTIIHLINVYKYITIRRPNISQPSSDCSVTKNTPKTKPKQHTDSA